MVGQYLYRRDEKKKGQQEVGQIVKDEEDGLHGEDKAVGEVVEHIEEQR